MTFESSNTKMLEKMTTEQVIRTVTDFYPTDNLIRNIERPIPFMTETEEEKAQKPRRKNG